MIVNPIVIDSKCKTYFIKPMYTKAIKTNLWLNQKGKNIINIV